MGRVEIDTDTAIAVAGEWIMWGDWSDRIHLETAADIDRLQLPSFATSASDDLAGAAAELWTNAVYLRLLVDAVVGADASVAFSIEDVMSRAGAAVGRRFAPIPGDRGGTYLDELRSPYVIDASSDLERGRLLLDRALRDVSSNSQIRPDEFEVVDLGNGVYLLSLGGVTDLSDTDLGLSDVNRTVRDLDQVALGSFGDTSVAGNPYTLMVSKALDRLSIPPGSEILIVGHSAGADAALDLAADPTFNGPGRYRVTHVVAAGYDSEPQLDEVPASTKVLVLENDRDQAVHVEAMGDGGLVRLPLNLADEHADDVAQIAIGLTTLDRDRVRSGTTRLGRLESGTSRQRPSQVVAVFEGGGTGHGHDPAHYREHVRTTDDPDELEFLASFGATEVVGTAHAVDISVPD